MPAAPFDINRPRHFNQNLVWDTNTLEWVAMTQPGGGSLTEPVSVDDGGTSLTVDGSVGILGTVAVTQSGTWDEVGINDSGNSITVDDGGLSLTVDGPQTDAEDRAYQTATGTITASGQSVTLALNGAKGASVNFVDSSFNGSFKFYVSVDGGSNYIETQAFNIYGATGGRTLSNPKTATGILGFRIWAIVCPPGTTHVKVNAETGSSGSCAVTVKANDGYNLMDYAVTPSEASDTSQPVGGIMVMMAKGSTGTSNFKGTTNRYEQAGTHVLTLARVPSSNGTTITNTNDTATSTELATQNTSRMGGSITNTSSAVLYVLLENSGTASATRFTKRLSQWESWPIPECWIGQIKGVWATDPNDGVAIVQEYNEVG